jgi:hypothetical protein
MRKIMAAVLIAMVSSPSYAIWGVGDISFDPTTYGEVAQVYKQTVELYKTAMQQLDTVRKVEQTLREAQEAYQTVSNTKMKDLTSSLKIDPANSKTAAGLRAELQNMGDNLGNKSSYMSYQLSRLKQLENIEALQKISAANVNDTTGKINQATADRITAQSTATLATLAAAEEQRRAQEDVAKAAAAKDQLNDLSKAKNVYDALGK